MPVGSITFLSLLSPVVAVLGGWAVLHRSLSVGQVVGVTIVLTAVLVVTLHPTRSGRRAAGNSPSTRHSVQMSVRRNIQAESVRSSR